MFYTSILQVAIRFEIISPLVARDPMKSMEGFHWESFEVWLDVVMVGGSSAIIERVVSAPLLAAMPPRVWVHHPFLSLFPKASLQMSEEGRFQKRRGGLYLRKEKGTP